MFTGRITASHCGLSGDGRLCGYSRTGRRQHLARALIAPLIAWPPLALLFGETPHMLSEPSVDQIQQVSEGDAEISPLLSSCYLARLETVSLLPDVSAAVCSAAGDRSKIGHRFAKTQEHYLSCIRPHLGRRLPWFSWWNCGDITTSQSRAFI